MIKELLRAMVGYLTRRNYNRVNRRIDLQNREIHALVEEVEYSEAKVKDMVNAAIDQKMLAIAPILENLNEEDVVELLEKYKITEAQVQALLRQFKVPVDEWYHKPPKKVAKLVRKIHGPLAPKVRPRSLDRKNFRRRKAIKAILKKHGHKK